MATDKLDPKLMKAGDKAFWKEFHESDRRGERYFVIDHSTGEVIVENAVLTREKKKIKV